MKARKRAWVVFGYVACSLLLAEGMCRLQQTLGPIWDLELAERNVDLYRTSETLNHMHRLEQTFRFFDKKRFGKHYGDTYTQYYDENGVRLNSRRPSHDSSAPGLRILFMGDSFIQGYDDGNTIPHLVWLSLKQRRKRGPPLYCLNAGASSYSTLIYIAQAKQLIPKLRPQFVMVNFDETDLGDDYSNYGDLVVRDARGKVVAVRSSRLLREARSSLEKVRRHRLYCIRFLAKAYHYRIRLRLIEKEELKRRASSCPKRLSRESDQEARQKYAAAIAMFEKNLGELAEALVDLMGDKQRILLAFHPRREHLKPDPNGDTWNHVVSDTIRRVAAKYGVAFYDATEDLRRAFGDQPEQYYWGEPDMHFNFEGMRIYSEHLAEALAKLMERKPEAGQ